MRLSPKLFSAFCPCPPQPAAAEEAALPSPTSCVRPVCGFGLQSASAGCEYTPVPPTEGRRDVGLRGTGAAADPSSLCPCQLRCARLLCKHPCSPGKPNLPKVPGRPLASSLATRPWLKGHLMKMGLKDNTLREGPGTRELVSPLLLGNKRLSVNHGQMLL